MTGPLAYILNPPVGITLLGIVAVSFVLGLLHGATPDEHTWPITFSYAIGSYSTRKGMKAGFVFSAGFTAQRALLTTLGFLGLALLYKRYDLTGPVYVAVGIAMFLAGAYILGKSKYLHLPLDRLLGGHEHHLTHTYGKKRAKETGGAVNLNVAALHGFIAGFGFGAYAAIITFVLAPRVPSLLYAPLPGLFFGLGTMAMQIVFGAAFGKLARLKRLGESNTKKIAEATSGRTLYYGGLMFAVMGLLIVMFPAINSVALHTGSSIPNLDALNVATFLVLFVVGGIGIGSFIHSLHREMAPNRGKRRTR